MACCSENNIVTINIVNSLSQPFLFLCANNKPFAFKTLVICIQRTSFNTVLKQSLFLIGSLILQTKDFSWLVMLTVYGVDSVLTIIHRLLLHENIGLPHRKHLYQIMVNELRIPHVVVSLLYMIVQIVIIIGYLYCRGYGDWYLLGCILLLSGIYIGLMRKYFHLHLLPKR